MATPPVTDRQCLEAFALYQQNGENYSQGALAGGYKSIMTFKRHCRECISRGLHISDGVQDALNQTGIGHVDARRGWSRVPTEEGGFHSVQWEIPKGQEESSRLDAIREAFEGLEPRAKVEAPKNVQADLMSVLPLFDVHWNMAAWAEETGGEDYNIDLAREDLMRSLETLLGRTQKADTCFIILGGDFLHANGAMPFTGSRAHPLDVAGSHYKAIDTGIAIIKYAVRRCLEHYANVKVRVIRGNHDPDSHLTIAFALREWLANNERAEVIMTPNELTMLQWGRVALFAQHGDKMKPETLALKFSDVCPFWSACPHRYAYTGHKHKLTSERIGGLNWERLEPFAPTDMYGASWVNRRAMKIDTYDKTRGRVGTVIDPIERPA